MGRLLVLLALAALVIGVLVLRRADTDQVSNVDQVVEIASDVPGTVAELEVPRDVGPREPASLPPRPAADESVPGADSPSLPEPPADAPLLVGQLVLEDGTPYPRKATQFSITRADATRVRSQPVETGAGGRFAFPLHNVEDPLVELRLTVREHSRAARHLTANVDLPPLDRGVTKDLGDVVLRLRAVGVVCRLVDRSGDPVASTEDRGPEVEMWGQDGRQLHDSGWEHGQDLVLRFDAGVESGWLALDSRFSSFFKPWFVDPLQPGADLRAVGGRTALAVRASDEVELVVAHGGTIRGSVVRGAGLVAGMDRVRVRSMHDIEPRTWGRSENEQVLHAAIEEDGSFEVADVDAGLRRVEFLAGRVALFTVEDVEVHLERATDDSRLQAVDLGVLTRTIALRVVDPGGALVPEAQATLAWEESYEHYSREGDDVLVLLPAVGAGSLLSKLVVHAPGFVPAMLVPPFRGGTVTLEPAIQVRARTAEPFECDVGSHGFWLRLRRVGAPDVADWLWATELPFGWDGTEPAELTAPGSGRYELEVMVKMRMGTLFGTTPSDRYVGTGVFLDVGPEHAASPLVVDVPEDLVRFDT